MISYDDPKQQPLPGFEKFHGFPLVMGNRWVKLSRLIPWDEFSKAYDKNMCPGMGRPAKPARLVLARSFLRPLKTGLLDSYPFIKELVLLVWSELIAGMLHAVVCRPR